jgi:chemotaxis family two-component system response regulator Rcp1
MNARVVEILLVEDNPADVRLTLEAFKEGRVLNHINVVGDGEQAMAYLRREGAYAQAAAPNLILLDLNLPKKDGREVLTEIKNDPKLKKIPVVVLTTSSAERDITSAYGAFASCYIKKPVELEEFLRVVHMIEGFWLSVVQLPQP